MASFPSVSVIVPAYQASGIIGRALDSVVAQTHLPNEIVVVDDGSPDDLGSAIARWQEWSQLSGQTVVRLLRKTNGGAASARNFGIDHSTRDLIAFLDADDCWAPTNLERRISLLQQHPEVGLSASDFWIEVPRTGAHQKGEVILPRFRDAVLRLSGAEVFHAAHCIHTSTVLVRRSALGEDRFDTSLRTAEDTELWIRLLLKTPAFFCSEMLTTVVILESSLTHSDTARDFPNMLTVLQRHGALLDRREFRHEEALVYRNWAAGHLAAGDARKALWPAWQRWQRQPLSPQAWWIILKAAAWSCFPRGSEK
jgi:glycosyltransferase involved in cell wall biosynthesis